MAYYDHILDLWNHLLWVQILAYIAIGTGLLMAVAAFIMYQWRPHALANRQRVGAWMLLVYIALEGLLLWLGSPDYVYLVCAGVLTSVVSYSLMRQMRGPSTTR